MSQQLSSYFPDKLQAMIFDCDGVLFDSRASNMIFFNRFLTLLDLPPLTKEQEEYAHIHTVDETLAYVVPVEKQALIPEKAKQINYHEEILPMLSPEPGLREFLKLLQARNIPLAICTNRTKSMTSLLQYFNLESYFNPVITVSNAAPKPDPEGLNKILTAWGRKAQHCVFVGDSQLDEQAAKAAGVPFFAYNNQALSACLHVQSFPELQEAILPILAV